MPTRVAVPTERSGGSATQFGREYAKRPCPPLRLRNRDGCRTRESRAVQSRRLRAASPHCVREQNSTVSPWERGLISAVPSEKRQLPATARCHWNPKRFDRVLPSNTGQSPSRQNARSRLRRVRSCRFQNAAKHLTES